MIHGYQSIRPPRAARSRARRGFTLIEASLATIVVGVAFVAALQLIATGTVVNVEATTLTSGMNVARGVNEYLLQKKFAELKGFNGTTWNPPRDSRGISIDGMSDWKQIISVTSVDPANLTKNTTDSPPQAVRVAVIVTHNDERVCDLSWYVFDGTP